MRECLHIHYVSRKRRASCGKIIDETIHCPQVIGFLDDADIDMDLKNAKILAPENKDRLDK